MKEDTTVIPFRHADSIDDPLTEIAREGARRMLAEALKAEADAFVAQLCRGGAAGWPQADCPARIWPRAVRSRPGSAAIDVRRPKVRDRGSLTLPRQTEGALHLEHLAAVGAALEEPRCAAAGALPARHLDR